MKPNARLTSEVAEIAKEAVDELTQRIQDIDSGYRTLAQKMGQLYMLADENKVGALTASLDKPMRNASDNEQAFAAILEELRMAALQRK